MYLKQLSLAALCGVAMLVSGTATAGILAQEQFATDGALLGMTPSPGPGNAWASHSGAGNKPVQVVSGSVALEQSGGSGEDVNVSFAPQGATDTTYARFEFSMSSNANSDIVNVDANGLYFAHLSSFRARTGVVAPAGGGDFGLAINADNSALGDGTTWASDLSFDTTYTAVISYNAGTGESKLWLDPVDMSSTSISDASTSTGSLIENFSLRQSNDYIGSQVVDNIVVAMTFDEALTGVVPEPASLVLMLAGLLGMGAMRRK